MQQLLDGYKRFRTEVFSRRAGLFQDLMQEWVSNSVHRNIAVVMEQNALEHKYWSQGAPAPTQAA